MRVHTDIGLLTIKELFEIGTPVNVAVDNRIKNKLDSDGNIINGSIRLDRHEKGSRPMPASAAFDTGVQECIRFTLENGQTIEVTEGHDMFIDDDCAGMKIKAKDVKIGDKVPILSGESVFGTESDPVLAELIGNLLGDGNFSKNNAVFNFFGKELEYGYKLYKLASVWHKNKVSFLSNPPGDKYKVPNARFSSTELGKIFLNKLGVSKKPIRVPNFIWKADKITISAFIRGLFAADGHIDNNYIGFSQKNLEFIKEIQILLAHLGFNASLMKHGELIEKEITYADGRKFWTKRQPCWRLSIGGKLQLEKFYNEVGMGVEYKQNKLLELINKNKNKKAKGSYRTSRILKIEKLGPKQTYCLSQPETEIITVNGIVTGNCRCHITTLLPGYGFDGAGRVKYVGKNYDAFKEQRGL
jgi:ribonucleoside-diphosphate reductase alpha chain